MTTTICPLFGELASDQMIGRAIWAFPGLLEGMIPTLSGAGGSAGWTLSANPGLRGVSAWRPKTLPMQGSFVVVEDAPINVTIEGVSAQPRIDLLVGAWAWTEGPIDANGQPTGVQTAGMAPVYAVLKGTPDAVSPQPPTINNPFDVAGRRAIPLLQIYVPPTGTPTITVPTLYDQRPESAVKTSSQGIGGSSLITYADVASMTAAAPPTNGTWAVVDNVGLFLYDATSALADNPPAVCTPFNGVGRWIRKMAPGAGGGGSSSNAMFDFNNYI